jgi:GTP-binding protein
VTRRRHLPPAAPVDVDADSDAATPEVDTPPLHPREIARASRGQRRRALGPLPAGAVFARPLVAIVGRPNVGKSTLFNRLAGRRLAIVEDVPGVTRDRHYADTLMFGREIVLVDTGGFDPDSDDPMMGSIARQVRLALAECDLVVCVLDASVEPQPADREAVRLLRETRKPVIFVANKSDTPRLALEANSYYRLGVKELIPVSALHGHGTGDLEQAVLAALPPAESLPTLPKLDGVARVAITGKPNAGKSSLVNRLLGRELQIVDSRPGTTVDAVDALYERGDRRLVLIDTAGIRRKSHVDESVESLAVLQAVRSMERSDVVVLLLDASAGVAEQDAKILGLAEDRGRAIVIALNKCDLLDDAAQHKAVVRARDVLAFVPWAPVVRISARSGRGIPKLLAAIDTAVEAHGKRITTAQLNRFFEEVLDRHPPPIHRGKPVRLYYVTQTQVAPPTFTIITNYPDAVHFSYQRYVVNQIREAFGFEGTPVRVFYKAKRRRDDDA